MKQVAGEQRGGVQNSPAYHANPQQMAMQAIDPAIWMDVANDEPFESPIGVRHAREFEAFRARDRMRVERLQMIYEDGYSRPNPYSRPGVR